MFQLQKKKIIMNNEKIFRNYIEKIEEDVITTILNLPQKMAEAILTLDTKDFYSDKCRAIYSALCEFNQNNSTQINKNILLDFFATNEKYQFENWQIYIETLITNFYNEDDFTSNIEIIYNASSKRQLDEFTNRIIETKIDWTKSTEQIADLQRNFLDIIERKKNSQLESIDKSIIKCYKSLEANFKDKRKITGTSIGFEEIDNITNGFQKGDLIILAARPGMGKTAIALNFIYNAAKSISKNKQGKKKKIVLFSLEMGKEQICRRLISLCAKAESIDSNKLRNCNFSEEEWDMVTAACDEISTLPILIDDSANLSIIDIQSKLKQLSNEYEIKLVVVDYLQLIRGQKIKGNVQYNRQQEVAFISKTLKSIARLINTPIIALAQMSRDIEKRSTGPVLADLRESGAIEQDADIVSFLYHPEPDSLNKNDEINGQEIKNSITNQNEVDIQFIIAKHRNGATVKIDLTLLKKMGLFIPREKQ